MLRRGFPEILDACVFRFEWNADIGLYLPGYFGVDQS